MEALDLITSLETSSESLGRLLASNVDLPPGAAHRSRTRRGVSPVICSRTTCRNMEEASCT